MLTAIPKDQDWASHPAFRETFMQELAKEVEGEILSFLQLVHPRGQARKIARGYKVVVTGEDSLEIHRAEPAETLLTKVGGLDPTAQDPQISVPLTGDDPIKMAVQESVESRIPRILERVRALLGSRAPVAAGGVALRPFLRR